MGWAAQQGTLLPGREIISLQGLKPGPGLARLGQHDGLAGLGVVDGPLFAWISSRGRGPRSDGGLIENSAALTDSPCASQPKELNSTTMAITPPNTIRA
jgi:hypothetical protein